MGCGLAGDGRNGMADRELTCRNSARRNQSHSVLGLMLAQLGIVVALSARVDRMAASTASLLFALYAALTGVTISFAIVRAYR